MTLLYSKHFASEFKAIVAEIMQDTTIDVAIALENMQPNDAVVALGMVVFLSGLGFTPEQIIERFRVQSHAKRDNN